MKHSTLVALMAIYDSDPARTSSDRETLQKLFGLSDSAVVSKPVERVISFVDAAKRLNRTTRTIHLLARRGVLRKARMPGCTRAAGVLVSDLDALLASMVVENGEEGQ